jgi:hypothetical protein
MDILRLFLLLTFLAPALTLAGEMKQPAIDDAAIEAAVNGLVELHGKSQAVRVTLGVRQVAERWWPEDGDGESFIRFCEENFIADEKELERTFVRLERLLEQVDGHLHEVRREILSPLELDTGPVMAVDSLFANVDLAAHVDDDLFQSKVAFLALLNFPVHRLSDRLEKGAGWDRGTWARSRMMDRFAQRVPADVSQRITRAFTAADRYIADYNIRMDRLVTEDGERLFPEGLQLITHWGLRDELKSQYANNDGLRRQQEILRVMERIVRQEIPGDVIDNDALLWAPQSNKSWRMSDEGSRLGEPLALEREPDSRYAYLLDIFHAVRAADPYTPATPSFIERKFESGRQIPESEVESLLASILVSDEFRETAALISRKLGRPLEPFDIWYNGFKAQGGQDEAELDRILAERYPNVAAFSSDLPRILTALGFTPEKAAWLAERIEVDPSRGAGHATGAVRREDKAHLRTRVGRDGMDYKGYNIAIHELGHNVEQVFSLNAIDHWWMQGVPNNAFTEAMAFLFQNRDLELLGLDPPGADARRMEALDTLWSCAEIGGVSLVDMKVWRWMYRNPEATPEQLREATLAIARQVWNEYFAPVFGGKDEEILAIYSHMIVYGLYLPDYAIGHIVGFQIADKMREGDFGKEFERMTRQGMLTPDAWMRGAVGGPISTSALLAAAKEALQAKTGS